MLSAVGAVSTWVNQLNESTLNWACWSCWSTCRVTSLNTPTNRRGSGVTRRSSRARSRYRRHVLNDSEASGTDFDAFVDVKDANVWAFSPCPPGWYRSWGCGRWPGDMSTSLQRSARSWGLWAKRPTAVTPLLRPAVHSPSHFPPSAGCWGAPMDLMPTICSIGLIGIVQSPWPPTCCTLSPPAILQHVGQNHCRHFA